MGLVESGKVRETRSTGTPKAREEQKTHNPRFPSRAAIPRSFFFGSSAFPDPVSQMVLGAIKAFARDHTILFASFSMGFAGLGLIISKKGETVSVFPRELDAGGVSQRLDPPDTLS